jgi:hypothetical protein
LNYFILYEKQEPFPLILRIEKVGCDDGGNDGDNNCNDNGSGTKDGSKKIII